MIEPQKLIQIDTPASISLHWQENVHEDLLRDEALGILEKVPIVNQYNGVTVL